MTPRRRQNRTRQNQINILHTTTRKRHSQKQIVQTAVWCSVVLAMIVGIGAGLHIGVSLALDQVLYHNPHYSLKEIDVEPRDRFADRLIRQSAGLEIGQNLWTLNLPQIARDLEKLPSVSTVKVERHFPDKLTIVIHERVPVVKIYGLDMDLGTREMFYLDHDCVVLKPRDGETARNLPEVIGLVDADLEPGTKLDRHSLRSALQILDAIDHTKLNATIDIRTINLADPLSITMTTSQQVAIDFRTDCVDQQLFRLQQIFDLAGNRALHTIDLTPDIYVPVTFFQ